MSKTTNFKFSKQLLPIDIGVEKKGTLKLKFRENGNR